MQHKEDNTANREMNNSSTALHEIHFPGIHEGCKNKENKLHPMEQQTRQTIMPERLSFRAMTHQAGVMLIAMGLGNGGWSSNSMKLSVSIDPDWTMMKAKRSFGDDRKRLLDLAAREESVCAYLKKSVVREDLRAYFDWYKVEVSVSGSITTVSLVKP